MNLANAISEGRFEIVADVQASAKFYGWNPISIGNPDKIVLPSNISKETPREAASKNY